MFDWKVRFSHKEFWIALIPACLVLVQQIAAMFGHPLDLAGVSDQLLGIINSIFLVLTIMGVVNDPTTKGLADPEDKE